MFWKFSVKEKRQGKHHLEVRFPRQSPAHAQTLFSSVRLTNTLVKSHTADVSPHCFTGVYLTFTCSSSLHCCSRWCSKSFTSSCSSLFCSSKTSIFWRERVEAADQRDSRRLSSSCKSAIYWEGYGGLKWSIFANVHLSMIKTSERTIGLFQSTFVILDIRQPNSFTILCSRLHTKILFLQNNVYTCSRKLSISSRSFLSGIERAAFWYFSNTRLSRLKGTSCKIEFMVSWSEDT